MLIIGHRGARGLAPENTMASLQAALDNRVSTVEIDVRVTKDSIAILHHDPYVELPGHKFLDIDKADFLDLQKIKPDLITLEAALHFIDRRVDTIVEVKPGVATEPISASIAPRIIEGRLENDIIFASKDFKLLQKLHKAFPNIPTAVIEPWSGVRARLRANKLGTKRIIMNQRWLWSGYIRATHRGGFRLYAYTINDPKKAKRWGKAGLYGAITDHPERFGNDARYL